METIATRIIKLCDVLNLSKSDFARRINVTPSYISKLGKSTESVPSERTIDDICRVFGVSKLWLKTGEGEMYVKRDMNQEIGMMVTALMKDADESFRKRFIDALLQVPPDGWNAIEEFVNKLSTAEKEPRSD